MLTHEQFNECLNGIFSVSSPSIDLELVECKQMDSHSGASASRIPFSLIFRGPMTTILPQQTYSMHNERMGDLEIFLVPIGPGGNGMDYEAIFT